MIFTHTVSDGLSAFLLADQIPCFLLMTKHIIDCEQVSQSMILVDDSSNPFHRLVLALASLRNPIILTMVLALGALSLAHAGRNEFHSVALRYKMYSMLNHTSIHSLPMITVSNIIAILMLMLHKCIEKISRPHTPNAPMNRDPLVCAYTLMTV